MRSYKPIHYKGIKDREVRDCFRLIDDILRQLSNQTSTPVADVPVNSSGSIVTSIEANSAGKRAGDIKLTNSAHISVTNSSNNFFFAITGLPASLFGSTQALTANSILADGVASTVSRSDHVHSLATAAQNTGFYGTTASVGTGNDLLRADARLVYPEALGTVASRANSVILTDGGANVGALLTAANTFSDNVMSFLAPNGTKSFSIGDLGTISTYGSTPNDNIALFFLMAPSGGSATIQQGIQSNVTNASTGGVLGIRSAITNSGANAVENVAFDTSISSTGVSTTGVIIGYRNIFLISGAGKTVASASGFKSIPSAITGVGSTLTDLKHFWAVPPAVATITTFTNQYGFYCDIVKHGVNRASFFADGATTGTPTNVYSFWSAGHTVGTNRYGVKIDAFTGGTVATSVDLAGHSGGTTVTSVNIGGHTGGTNRYGINIGTFNGGTIATGVEVAAFSGGTTMRSFRGGNTFENTATDFFCSAANKGLICKDSQGTAEFWRFYVDSTGTKDMTMTVDALGFASFTRAASATGNVVLSAIDTGTTAPAT